MATQYFTLLSYPVICGFDHGRHRPFGAFEPPVPTKAVDLIPGEFGLGKFAGDEDGSPHGIDLLGVTQSLFGGEDEDLLQHLDHVIVGMIVVVDQDYVVERDLDGLLGGIGSWSRDGYALSMPLEPVGAGHIPR